MIEEKDIIEKITATQKIARMLLKAIAIFAVAAASIYVYLDAFGVVEAPEKVKEIAAKADSIANDTLIVDTNAVK